MDTKAFATWMKKTNRSDIWRCLVLFAAAFASIFLDMDQFGVVGGLASALAFGESFFIVYLRIPVNLAKNQFADENLAELMRTHSFPVQEYFAYIRRRSLPWRGALLLASIVFAAAERDAVKLLVGIGVFAFSGIAGWCIQMMFGYRLTHRMPLPFGILCGLGRAVCGICRLYALAILLCVWVVVYALVVDFAVAGWAAHESVVYFLGGTWTMMAGILVFVLFLMSCLFHAAGNIKGRDIRTAPLLGILAAVVFAGGIFVQMNNYTAVWADRIITSDFSGKKVYSCGAVKAFRVFEDDSDVQFEFEFSDGRRKKLDKGSITCSPAYEERYYSEYDFFAELVPQYLANGAECSVSDVDALRADVRDYDQQLRDGLERLIEAVE